MVKVDGVRTVAVEKASSPVSRMTEDANRIEYEVDARGRKIGVRKYSFLNTHRLTCLMGDTASNETAMSQAIMAASVVEIDGDAVGFPTSLLQLHAIMARLDIEGVDAAARAMSKFFPARGDTEAERDAVKNS